MKRLPHGERRELVNFYIDHRVRGRISRTAEKLGVSQSDLLRRACLLFAQLDPAGLRVLETLEQRLDPVTAPYIVTNILISYLARLTARESVYGPGALPEFQTTTRGIETGEYLLDRLEKVYAEEYRAAHDAGKGAR